MIWRRKNYLPSSPPPHWSFVISKLKSTALSLAHTPDATGHSRKDSLSVQHQQHYEAFLSEMDDALELSRNLAVDDKSFCKVNINQVAADLGESFTQRYGADFICDFSFLVDHNLPIAQTHPYALMRILDCLVRGSERLRSSRQFSVWIKQGENNRKHRSEFNLVIGCDGLSLPSDLSRINAALKKFKHGNYLNLIHDLGLEFCAAFHLIRQLGGTIRLEPSERKLVNLRIEIELQRADDQFLNTAAPSRFFVMSSNAALIQSLNTLAKFHNSEIVLASDLDQVSSADWLVCDLSIPPTAAEIEYIKTFPNPQKTVLLVRPGTRSWQKELFLFGFKNFVTLPLISPKLLRALNGVDSKVQSLSSERRAAPKHGLSVLIVDDTATTRIVLRDYFDERGFTVYEATDGSEFSSMVKKGQRFDLIFCDVTMTHMDGVTAVKVLREFEKETGDHTPVVLMTAYSSNDIAKRTADLDIDCYLEKPIEPERLGQIVKQLISEIPRQDEIQQTEIIIVEDLRRRCAGRTRTMIRVLESFISLAQEYEQKISSRQVQTNHTELKKTLHTVKGLLREIAAIEAANVVELLEDKLRSKARLEEKDLSVMVDILASAKRSAESVKNHLSSTVH